MSPGPVFEDYPLQPVEKSPTRVFVLSPANTSALRGQLLLNKDSQFELAPDTATGRAPR